MLTIRRIPTIVSNYQDGSLEEEAGCGKNCLCSYCIPGAKLPLYLFGKSNAKAEWDKSFLDTIILSQWEERQSRGLFRYDVTACESKVLAGEYGFIAQLNEGRHMKKRPTEFRVDQVLQPFDGKKFNFTKVGQEEMLFCFEESQDGESHYYDKAVVKGSPNVVVINVSPIEYGHVLLVPRVLDCMPQQLETDTFLLALHMAVEANNPYFRLGYNSLGAFATINHLHFQAYYLAEPFPVEMAPTKLISGKYIKKGLRIHELQNYPVRGIVYELGNSSLDELAVAVVKACKILQERNIPFNVLIADRGSRVFIFPQCFAEKQARGEVEQEILDTQVNPAVWEISGHIVLKRREDYERATDNYAWRLLAEVSLDEEQFNAVRKMCVSVAAHRFRGRTVDDEKTVYYTLSDKKPMSMNMLAV